MRKRIVNGEHEKRNHGYTRMNTDGSAYAFSDSHGLHPLTLSWSKGAFALRRERREVQAIV